MAAELSLRAELLCSSGRLRTELLGTPVLGRCRFLFFTRMRPIRSWGLGKRTPGASWWAQTGQGQLGHPHPPRPARLKPPYRVLVQGVDEQRVPKDGAAVLGHLGLLLCPVGPMSEVRDLQGQCKVPGSEVTGAFHRPQWEAAPGVSGVPRSLRVRGCRARRLISGLLTSPRGSRRRG